MSAKTVSVDMESYLSRHEIVYRAPAMDGWEGFPLGNGSYGGMLWARPDGLVFQANHTDTLELPDPEKKNEGWAILRSCGRLELTHPLPIHDWTYLNRYDASLSLYRAQAELHAQCAFGSFRCDFSVHARHPVAILHYRARYAGELAESGSPVRVALERWGSRVFGWWYSGQQGGASMDLGQAEVCLSHHGTDLCLVAAFRGVSFALRCRVVGVHAAAHIVHARRGEIEIAASALQDFTVYLACVTSHEAPDPLAATLERLDAVVAEGPAALEAEHRRWWAEYWSRSFLHIPDDYAENLYYLHLYLMGASSRGRLPPLFNGALWTWNRDIRNWVNPHHWNEQMSFWCLPAANRCDLLAPYLRTYDELKPQALAATKERGYQGLRWSEQHDYAGRQLGLDSFSFKTNHTPAAQIALFFWWHYRFGGDAAYFRSTGLPFIEAVGDFYFGFITWSESKKEYEIPLASTYEDERPWRFTNSITNLAMARAILGILTRCASSRELSGALDPAKARKWTHMLEHLPAYVLNDRDTKRGVILGSGLVDGKELPPEENHGHGPVFCPVFPAGDIGLKDRGSELFAAASNTLATYSLHTQAITPVIVLAARLGMAEEARERLGLMIRNLQHFRNGMFFNIDHWHYLSRRSGVDIARLGELRGGGASYAECQRDYLDDRAIRFVKVKVQPFAPDGVEAHIADTPAWPFSQTGMESLGHMAAGLQEMHLQSHEGVIRVFPAVPDDWEGAFTLLAEGGFLVTSRKAPHQGPEYIEVESRRGGECVVALPWRSGSVASLEGAPVLWREREEGVMAFDTEPGRVYLVVRDGAPAPEPRRYTGTRNAAPKSYGEAMIGKPSEW